MNNVRFTINALEADLADLESAAARMRDLLARLRRIDTAHGDSATDEHLRGPDRAIAGIRTQLVSVASDLEGLQLVESATKSAR